jgi:hypothetical protein
LPNKINMKFRNIVSTSSEADSRSADQDFSAFYTTTARKYPSKSHILRKAIYSTALRHISSMTYPSLL